MDDNALQVLREHLDFVKWMIGGAASGLVLGSSIVYKTILIPMRDQYLLSAKENTEKLNSVATTFKNHDEWERNRAQLFCRFVPSTGQSAESSLSGQHGVATP